MSFKEAVRNVMKHSGKHSGSQSRRGKARKYTEDEAAAIVAAASRNASPAAKRRNPNLKKVK